VPDYRVNIFVERVFDQILALLAWRNATVVVCVQGSALCTFRRAQRRGVKCVLIAQTPDPHVEAEIVLAEESRLGLRPQRAAARNAYAERVRQEFAHADLIMANSEFTKSDIVTNGVPETKVVVTQLGVDQDKFKARDSSRASSEPNVALFVGSVQARKGVIHFARAVDELRKKDIDIIGRAVGVVDRAYARCLQPFIESKAIQLVGPTSHHRLTSEYENADVFVFPTLSDGYGLVVLEAMACGVPAVVSNRCGAPVIDGTNALVVPHGNASALSDGIERILQDASLRETLRQGGLQTARSVSWPAYRGQVREILKGINGV
jgi:glycosyltransferase involved in cell wall biosynthesis